MSHLLCGACGAELSDTLDPSPTKFWLASDTALDTIDQAGPPLEPSEIERRLAMREVWCCTGCGSLGIHASGGAFVWFRPLEQSFPTKDWLK